MPITLNEKTLPEDLDWIDEFGGWSPVKRSITEGSTGRNINQFGALVDGRPITLSSESFNEVAGVASRQDVLDIEAMLSVTEPMTLVIDDRSFSVVWDDESPFTATPLYRISDPDLTTPYKIKLKLITVTVEETA